MLGKVAPFVRNGIIPVRAAQFSNWSGLDAAPADPILGLNEAYKKDTHPKKVLLGMGAYRDNEDKPYILECVRKAEEIILQKNMDHEYAPIQGIDSYVKNAVKLAFGENSDVVKNDRVAGA
jgi:aspartate aminotransferase